MAVSPDILVQSERWRTHLEDPEQFVKRICTQVFLLLDVGQNRSGHIDISIVLADDAFITTLNASYRGKNMPTNVLSFPACDIKPGQAIPTSEMEVTLGDVIIALETVEREATEQGKSFDAHVTHMLVHGILHLLGYDHMTESEAKEMETLEITILRDLGINNPYEIRA